MLYWFCLIQIVVYLFVSPFARELSAEAVDYWYSGAVVFLFAYIVGAATVRRRGQPHQMGWQLHTNGEWLLILWSILYIVCSVQYGLFNRRIGTDAAAELFASIPIYVLAVFRTFEVILPLAISMLLAKVIRRDITSHQKRWQFVDTVCGLSMGSALLLSGALYSRSQLTFILVSVLVLVQNLVGKVILKQIVLRTIAVGILVLIGVSLYRWASLEDGVPDGYFFREIVVRLDGLEVVSRLISDHGLSWGGVNFHVIFAPLVSAVPFLPEAAELKALALTTVKANILYHEYGSPQRDINSFMVLDVYYWGGMIGLVLSGLVVGIAARWVDRNVGTSKGLTKTALMVAIASNILFMEREFVLVVINTVRDWFIIYLFMALFVRRSSLGTSAKDSPMKADAMKLHELRLPPKNLFHS